MSKQIKQMEMDSLRQNFQEVRDMVMMTVSGLDSQTENHLRLTLQKKNIRLQMVKNSLARRVFEELAMPLEEVWEGPTTLAWGSTSLADLCKELDGLLRKNDKVKFKAAISEGQKISFAQGLKMPTRQEALGQVVMLMLSPGRRLAGQLLGPASRVAAQIKSLADKLVEAPAA